MTDPARTTKEEREDWRLDMLHDRDLGYEICSWAVGNALRLLDDADAADALRAQVAALQAERDETQRLYRVLMDRDFPELRAELAAAQDKLADWQKVAADRTKEIWRLMDENAALRTKAEALERERDAYKGMFELVERIPTMTDEQLEQVRQNALAAKALAEKP